MSLYSIDVFTTLMCIYLGMMSLNLSMEKPFKQIFQRKITPLQIVVLRLIGWIFLSFAMLSSIAAWTVVVGIPAWFGIATFVVGLMIYTQAYQPIWVWRCGIAIFVFLVCLQFLRFSYWD